MAKITRRVGTGITARDATTYDGEDIAPALEAFSKSWNAQRSEAGSDFGAVVLVQERQCRAILAEAGPGRFAPDSLQDYARRILQAIELTQRLIERKDADQAARSALEVGVLITEAHLKGVWEKPALRGANAIKTDENLRAVAAPLNTAKRQMAELEHAQWRATSKRMLAQNRYMSKTDRAKRIAKKAGRHWRTIYREIQ